MERNTTNFNLKISPELKAEFMAAAAAAHRPAALLVRDMMRDYAEKQRKEVSYNEFLRKKVEAGLKDYQEGRYHTNEEVTEYFKNLRKEFGSDE